MLRTFSANPGLGGFGEKEAATSDAFCQIVKELVDNAVDACTTSVVEGDTDRNRRVRVLIEKYREQEDLLSVTVSENGCGMENIADCVGAFHSTKQTDKPNKASSKAQEETTDSHTAGRYGVGLTLCLLHAQRLVPNACAFIQSATRNHSEWNVVQAVVDTENDKIRCIPSPRLEKTSRDESGTSVSVLLPGGKVAFEAWPCLAEYFARFDLSLDLTCSLEVLAPTLSRVPLFIRPSIKSSTPTANQHKENESGWRDGFSDDDLDQPTDSFDRKRAKPKKKSQAALRDIIRENRKRDICEAARQFLDRPVDLANVAYEVVPIHTDRCKSKRKRPSREVPALEVAFIVHGPIAPEEQEDNYDSSDNVGDQRYDDAAPNIEPPPEAKMTLVRMVNKIPLLDSPEAAACGVVQSLAAKKRIWNSFGLDVALNMESISTYMAPTYDVRDSDQVGSLIKSGVHDLLDSSQKHKDINETEADEDREGEEGFRMLPAKIRLGNILVIVQIHAKPSTLPLPTLSKGRLPINEESIDTALEVGVSKCLQQLQKSNPSLLLTGASLRKAERDAFYVPAIAEAFVSLLFDPANPDMERLSRLAAWERQDDDQSASSNVPFSSTDMSSDEVCRALQKRIRLVLSQPAGQSDQTEPIAASQIEESSVIEKFALSSYDSDWDFLQEDIQDHPKGSVDPVTNVKPHVLKHPTPLHQNPRKLLYESSDEESNGYVDW